MRIWGNRIKNMYVECLSNRSHSVIVTIIIFAIIVMINFGLSQMLKICFKENLFSIRTYLFSPYWCWLCFFQLMSKRIGLQFHQKYKILVQLELVRVQVWVYFDTFLPKAYFSYSFFFFLSSLMDRLLIFLFFRL